MPRLPLIITIAALLVAVSLTGATFARWMISHRAVRHFDVEFVRLCPGPDPTDFEVHLRLQNASDTETDVRNLAVLLDLEERLIASTTHRPQEGLILPGETAVVRVPLRSTFPAYRLPEMDECVDVDERWSVRLELYLRHPIREDTFTLRRIRTLGE